MFPQSTKLHNFTVTFLNKSELKILDKEIFGNEIYKINIKKKNPLIFDIGSHIGLSILYFKKNFPDSKIVGFEPNPNVFPLLEDNIKGNNIRNVTLYNLALSKNNGERILYIDSSGDGAFSTSSFIPNAWNGKQKSRGIKVKTVKLSTYIHKPVDLLKIDTEGAELEILQDLYTSKKFNLIKNIVLEYHPVKKFGLKRVLEILKSEGFTINTKEDMNGDEGLIFVIGNKSPK
jgi:FkbM family methyltransferase